MLRRARATLQTHSQRAELASSKDSHHNAPVGKKHGQTARFEEPLSAWGTTLMGAKLIMRERPQEDLPALRVRLAKPLAGARMPPSALGGVSY